MAGSRVLLVEDDVVIGRSLCQALEGQGYTVAWVRGGEQALAEASADTELVLLDLGLPDIDGLEVCRRLRAAHPVIEILVLTARREEIDVVVGLDAGADDYLVKPFRLAELLARVRARLRRTETGEQLTAGPLSMDLAARRAFLDGEELDLRPKEFDLLALLVAERGRVVQRERIMAEVWDEHWFGTTKTLDIHISALRRKLDRAAGPSCITTLRGVGYRMEWL